MPTSQADIGLLIVLACFFCGVAGIAWLILLAPRRTGTLDHRVAEAELYRVNFISTEEPAVAEGSGEGDITRVALSLIDWLLRARNARPKIAEDLDRAGIALRAQEWMLIRLSGAVICMALVFFLTGISILLALPIGFLLSWVPTRLYLKIKMAKRCAAFAEQLPDVLQLVASSLRSGFSLSQALDGVVREGSRPAAPEIARALAEARLGVDIEDALDKVADRLRCQDLSWVVMAVQISRQVGGNLAEVLLTTVHTMRERGQLKRQVRALSAEGRLSAYVLVGMPIGISFWLFLTRREYLRPLYSTGMGLVMLSAAIVGILVGSWWLSRIVKVEV
jgi:tight adherence protein B